MVFIVMGVAGSGKTTVGKILARRLGLPFHDADDDHSEDVVAKMRKELPLTDEDRKPWLDLLAQRIAKWNSGAGAVLACSALKEDYRRILTSNGAEEVTFIHLHGPSQLISSRLQSRQSHYFPPSLLESQFEILEVPDGAISVDIESSPQEIAQKIIDELSNRGVKP